MEGGRLRSTTRLSRRAERSPFILSRQPEPPSQNTKSGQDPCTLPVAYRKFANGRFDRAFADQRTTAQHGTGDILPVSFSMFLWAFGADGRGRLPWRHWFVQPRPAWEIDTWRHSTCYTTQNREQSQLEGRDNIILLSLVVKLHHNTVMPPCSSAFV